MENAARYLYDDLQDWCSLVLVSFKPERVLFFGAEQADVVREFHRLGVEAVGLEIDRESSRVVFRNPDGSKMDRAGRSSWDLFIISSSTVSALKERLPQVLMDLVASSSKVLLVLFPNTSMDLPLPAVSRWLREREYFRDFQVELWIEDRILTCAFVPQKLIQEELIQIQDAEWYRLALLNQKRRLVMQEYMDEHVHSVMNYVQELLPAYWKISVLEHDLEVYHNSRTAKVIRAVQKVRDMFFIPPKRS